MELKEVIAQLGLVLKSSGDQECRIIVTQIDPDAIGSAVALKVLLERAFHKKSVILYCGGIGHSQNHYLFLRYNLRQWLTPIGEDSNADKGITILVDSCSVNDRRIPNKLVLSPRIVIDHHREDDGRADRDGLIWVEDAGATAVLMIELCQELMPSVLEDPMIALLLALAIYTDTKSLKHTRKRDRRAYDVACSCANESELTHAINYRVRKSYFVQLARAIKNWRHKDGKLITGIGTVPDDEADNVSTVADELIRMEGVTLVLVWAIVGNIVRISSRTSGTTVDLGGFMKRCFGNGGGKVGPDGNGEGGAIMENKLPSLLSGLPSRKAIEKEVGKAVYREVCKL